MRKMLFFFLCIFMLSAALIHADVSAELDFTSITEKVDGENLSFVNSVLLGDPGAPDLPLVSYTLLLPPDADLDTVSASLTGQAMTILNGSFVVAPAPAEVCGEELVYPAGKTIVDGKDTAVYSTDAFYPENPIVSVASGQLHGYKLVEVSISPYRYNPVTGSVSKLSGATLTLTFDTLRSVALTPNAGFAAERVSELALNYGDQAKAYTVGQRSAAGYVILTTSAIQSGSSALQEFVNFKVGKGYNVTVYTENTWGGGTGDAAADNIRAWLQSNYQSLGIKYLLLIGDPTPETSSLPMKVTYPNRDTDTPSDFYYQDLTGNWNLDGDTLFGEYSGDYGSGGADKYAEINAGRIPVYNNDMGKLDAILRKIIKYGTSSESSVSWRKKALLPMAINDSATQSQALGDTIKRDVLTAAGFGWHRVYQFPYLDTPETMPCSYQTVLSTWMGDRFGLTVWWTHGLPTSASHVMNASNAMSLDDNYPVFTFQASCLNAHPETTNNLAYTLLNNGSVNSVAATRSAYGPFGEVIFNTAGIGGIAFEYTKHLITSKLPAADSLNGARETLTPKSGTNWANYCMFSVYGDPSLSIFDTGDGVVPTPTPTATPTATMTPTPTATPTATPEYVNIALGKPVQVSGVYAAAYGGENAVDGSAATVWGSAVSNSYQWIYVDLGAVTAIDGVSIDWYDRYYASQYQIYVSDNAVDWTLVTTQPSAGGTDTVMGSVSCRYAAMLALTKHDVAVGVTEFRVLQVK